MRMQSPKVKPYKEPDPKIAREHAVKPPHQSMPKERVPAMHAEKLRLPKEQAPVMRAPKTHAPHMEAPKAPKDSVPKEVHPKGAKFKMPSSAKRLEGYGGSGKMGNAY